MRIGFALKYHRLKAGIKQKDLARATGISPAYLSLIEADRRAASLELLERIADVLKVPFELLLLEARQQSGWLSPRQIRILNRAKDLVALAVRIERDTTGRNATTLPAVAETPPQYSHHGASSPPPQPPAQQTRKRRKIR